MANKASDDHLSANDSLYATESETVNFVCMKDYKVRIEERNICPYVENHLAFVETPVYSCLAGTHALSVPYTGHRRRLSDDSGNHTHTR